MRKFTPLLLLTIAIAGLLLRTGKPERELAPRIVRTVQGVDGFELRHLDFNDSERPHFLPNFELGYAIWAGYPFVLYRDKIYERAGPGGVFIRPRGDAQARYLVEEAALERRALRHDVISTLRIVDQQNGALLGERDLHPHRVENGNGWTGQHAAEFVRKVLLSETPIGGAVGVKPYGQAPIAFDTLPGAGVQPAEHGGAGCPARYAVKLQMPGGNKGLDTGEWAFMPQSGADSIVCDGRYILVLSGYGNWLHLDLLHANGRHLFQTDLKMDVDVTTYTLPERLKVKGNQLTLDLFRYERVNRNGDQVLERLGRVRATIEMTRARASHTPTPSAALAVK
jgi:hypothetical protein